MTGKRKRYSAEFKAKVATAGWCGAGLWARRRSRLMSLNGWSVRPLFTRPTLRRQNGSGGQPSGCRTEEHYFVVQDQSWLLCGKASHPAT